MILIFLLPLILTTLIFKINDRGIRESLILSYIYFLTFIMVTTESLSIIKSVAFLPLVTIYIIISAVLGCIILFRILKNDFPINRFLLIKKIGMGKSEYMSVIIIIMILLITFITAIRVPPNNVDSLIYHLARIMHWVQNQSVAFYNTSIPSQNFLAPLAEYAILHFYLIMGSDIYSSLVQWYSLKRNTPKAGVRDWIGGTVLSVTYQKLGSHLSVTSCEHFR